jgi:hypothetical protein
MPWSARVFMAPPTVTQLLTVSPAVKASSQFLSRAVPIIEVAAETVKVSIRQCFSTQSTESTASLAQAAAGLLISGACLRSSNALTSRPDQPYFRAVPSQNFRRGDTGSAGVIASIAEPHDRRT